MTKPDIPQKKLSFEEFLKSKYVLDTDTFIIGIEDNKSLYDALKECWNIAQENK